MATSTVRMEVQVFGTRKNAATRAALRFWSERRVPTHFVDLAERPASPGELRRFAQKHGVTALIDSGSKRYAELGLAQARYGDDRWLQILAAEPLVLKQPLTRWQHRVTIGAAPDAWTAWLAE
jgi:arsenate reductase